MKEKEIIERAKVNLDFIKQSIFEINNKQSTPKIKQKAIANVIIFGRSLTFILQNLKTPIGNSKFDDWYKSVLDV